MADNNANTPRTIAGFIDRDGVKHSVAGSGGGGDYSELIEMINGKVSKPITPADVLKDHIVVWGADKTIVRGGKKLSDLALANHTHDAESITGLDKSTEVFPSILCIGDQTYITGGSTEQSNVYSLQGLISRSVAGNYSALGVDVFFNIGSTENEQEYEYGDWSGRSVLHVWSELESGQTNRYDFHIEVYNGDTVWYTTVYDVRPGTTGLNFGNTTFESEWNTAPVFTPAEMEKHFVPRTLALDNEQDLAIMSDAAVCNLWKGCKTGHVYPLIVELWNNRQGTSKTTILGQVIARGTGSQYPSLEIYFANYFVGISGDGDETAAEIRSGSVAPADTGWDLIVTDLSNVINIPVS